VQDIVVYVCTFTVVLVCEVELRSLCSAVCYRECSCKDVVSMLFIFTQNSQSKDLLVSL